MFSQIACLVIVGILWGGTNPIIKKKSKNIVEVKANSKLLKFILEIKYLATNFEYLILMLINQLGSVLFYISLNIADLTLAVPVANSLTFVFTAISGWIVEGELPKKGTCLGALFVIVGTTLCCFGKYQEVT